MDWIPNLNKMKRLWLIDEASLTAGVSYSTYGSSPLYKGIVPSRVWRWRTYKLKRNKTAQSCFTFVIDLLDRLSKYVSIGDKPEKERNATSGKLWNEGIRQQRKRNNLKASHICHHRGKLEKTRGKKKKKIKNSPTNETDSILCRSPQKSRHLN